MKLLKYTPLLLGLSFNSANANQTDITTSDVQNHTRNIIENTEGYVPNLEKELTKLLNDSDGNIGLNNSRETSKNEVIENYLAIFMKPLNRKGGTLLENEKEELKNIIANWYNSPNKDEIDLRLNINNSAYMLQLCKATGGIDQSCREKINNKNDYLKKITPAQMLEEKKLLDKLIDIMTNN